MKQRADCLIPSISHSILALSHDLHAGWQNLLFCQFFIQLLTIHHQFCIRFTSKDYSLFSLNFYYLPRNRVKQESNANPQFRATSLPITISYLINDPASLPHSSTSELSHNHKIVYLVVITILLLTLQIFVLSFPQTAAQSTSHVIIPNLSRTLNPIFLRNQFIYQLNPSPHIIIKQYRTKMSNLDSNEFQDLIKALSSDCLYKKAIHAAQKRYLVKQLSLAALHPSSVVKLINRNCEKSQISPEAGQQDGLEVFETVWALNEYKIFVWVSVCYGFLNNRDLQNFITPDLLFLQSLFRRKSLAFLEYHINSLLRQSKNGRKKWNEEEEELLVDIVQTRENSLVWSEISFLLYLRSEKLYFRTPQKCREKWFNHLSPEVNRNKWTQEEDCQLFAYVVKHGPKWALISKLFNGSRTEHMVKNRYNSYVKKYQSKIQRTSLKKLIERIQLELAKKLKRQDQGPNSQEDIQDYSGQGYSLQASPQMSLGSVEKQTERQTLELTMQRSTRLDSLDLQEILFTQNGKMEQPNYTQVQLIQVQLYNPQPKHDEYLSLLF